MLSFRLEVVPFLPSSANSSLDSFFSARPFLHVSACRCPIGSSPSAHLPPLPMSDDSPASTQAPLTPQSTGSVDLDPSPNGKDKPDPFPWINKQRRQVAFYPNLNSSNKPQKPFSRSAARRESVMTLGSIEHLQHYFTKTGLAANRECAPTAPSHS